MTDQPAQASFWHTVAVVWRLEGKRLGGWRGLIALLVVGAAAAALASVAAEKVALLVAQSGDEGALAWWPLVSRLAFPERHGVGHTYVTWHVLGEYARTPTLAAAGMAAAHVAHALQRYVLPAVAALALAGRDEQWRVGVLRHGGARPAGLLVGKWLGVLTPFVLCWLLLVVAPCTWGLGDGAARDLIVSHLASSLLSLLATAALGLCASSLLRAPTCAVPLAYLLSWGVSSAATGLGGSPDQIALTPSVRPLVVSNWIAVAVSAVVIAVAFVVGKWGLGRQWREGREAAPELATIDRPEGTESNAR